MADYITRIRTADGDKSVCLSKPLIFTGAVEETYDGSEEKTINIPEVETSIPRITKTSDDTDSELQPNTLYVFPEMQSLNITLATPSDTSIVNEYHFIFTSGATATTLTLPETLVVDAYIIESNKVYEVSILENICYVRGVSNA